MEKKIVRRIIEYIFFSNFFMGIMALALNLETNIRYQAPLNQLNYYIFTTAITILFYLFAYRVPKSVDFSVNPRIDFYVKHRKVIQYFNICLYFISALSGICILIQSYQNLLHLGWIHYFILFITFILSTSYYNWTFGLSLRRFTWFKPTLIAWTWAITTVYLPLVVLQLSNYTGLVFDLKFCFLFIQTFMYFIVNAIMFDMKDYEDDTNRKLKTFVVRYGYYTTLNRIIFPLIALGFLSFIFYGYYYNIAISSILLLEIPVLLLALFAYRLNQRKSILFYLVAIDGMIVLKALFGILSTLSY